MAKLETFAALVISMTLLAPAARAQTRSPDTVPAPSSSTSTPAASQTPASAETQGNQSTALPMVTVTAHGFAVQQFKLAAVDTAFSATELRTLQTAQIHGVMDLVPGLAFTQSQQTGLSFISIRGISQNRNTTSPVVTRLDGVNEIDPGQFNQAMYDLRSVEVIKGPEGALYGPDAVAGAILIKTADPTNYYTGYARLDAGDFGQHGGEFGVGGPIIKDRLQFRWSGLYKENSGFFYNATLQQKEDPQKRYGTRLKLRWLAAPDLTISLQGSFQRTLARADIFHYQPAIVTATGTLAPGPFPFDFSQVDANAVSRTFYNNNIGHDDYKLYQDHLTAEYDGLSFAHVKFTGAYDYLTEFTTGDQFPYTASTTRNTLLGSVDGAQTQFINIRGMTDELRLTSKAGVIPNLHWLFGLYYANVNRFISTTTSIDKGLGIAPLYYSPDFSSPYNPTSSFLADGNHNFTRSVLGNIGYDLPLGFSIDLADRWDRVDKNQFVAQSNTTGVPGAVNRATFVRNSPRVTLQWVHDNLNLYATYGEGLRVGGFNQNGVGAAASLVGLNGVRDRIKQEVTRTYEVGFKSKFLNHRVEIDGDVYHIRDSNQPFFVFVGQLGAQVLINIDQAKMYGGDLSVKWLAFVSPRFGRLSLYGNATYNNSYITQYALNPADVGNKLPQAPALLWHAGFTYDRHVFDVANDAIGAVSLFTRWDFSGRSREAWDADNSSFQGAYNTLNIRVGLRGNNTSLMASILNATDTRYNEEFSQGGFTFPGLPRTVLLSLGLNFGR